MKSPVTTLKNFLDSSHKKYGFKLYIRITLLHGLTMFGLNMLTWLLCVPVVTAPAAICSLNRVLIKLTLDGRCEIMKEYWREFKNSFLKVIPFFAITTAFFVGIVILILALLSAANKGLAEYIILGFCILVGVLIYLVFTYAVLLFAIVDLPIRTNIKNAMLITLSQPKQDIYIVSMPLAITVLSALFLPNTFAMFILIIPAFTILMSCCIFKPILERKIVVN